MIKLTLDTNALRDLASTLGKSPEERYKDDPQKQKEIRQAFVAILDMRDRGQVELGVTTQFFNDFWRTKSKPPPYLHLEDLIGNYIEMGSPSILGFPLVFPVELAERDKYEELFTDVFPQSKPGHHEYDSNRRDAWQLYAHIVARRDIFITTDKEILQRADLLSKKWSIKVSSPSLFVANDTH